MNGCLVIILGIFLLAGLVWLAPLIIALLSLVFSSWYGILAVVIIVAVAYAITHI